MKSRGEGFFACFVLTLVCAGAVGWVWNIVKIMDSAMPITGMLIVRIIGVFMAPLGAILGYF